MWGICATEALLTILQEQNIKHAALGPGRAGPLGRTIISFTVYPLRTFAVHRPAATDNSPTLPPLAGSEWAGPREAPAQARGGGPCDGGT